MFLNLTHFRLVYTSCQQIFVMKIADGWIRIRVLWSWKRQLYHLRHNHLPREANASRCT